MRKMTEHITTSNEGLTTGDHKLAEAIIYLIGSDLAWVGRGLLKILRMKWHNRTIRTESGTMEGTPTPTGPFATTRKEQEGDLLLWVPRRIDSYLIDELTGGYGYSHSTVDTGEIDLPTRKPVMAEITIGQTVTRKFQDEYGGRPFVRVALSRAGVNVEQFVACVKSKLGEQYDVWDALTLGEIDDPAKEICSRLVADCLPEQDLRQIAWAKRLGLLRKGSVSVHSKVNALKTNAFISPNAFAEYFGAPKGRKLTGPDIQVQPQPVDLSLKKVAAGAARHHGWKVAVGILATMLLVFVVKRNH